MHSYSEGKDLLAQLKDSIDIFYQTASSYEVADAKEIFQEVEAISNIASELLSGTALSPFLQKQLFVKFIKASQILRTKSVRWTDAEKSKMVEEQSKIVQMIKNVKKVLGLDVVRSAMTQYKSYIQPELSFFLHSVASRCKDQETATKLKRAYVSEVLFKNLSDHVKKHHNQNAMTVVFRESDRGNENEFVISCMYIDKKTNSFVVPHVWCYAHPETNTWSLSSSDPGIYQFDQFLEHVFLPFMKKSAGNENLSIVQSVQSLTQQEISHLCNQVFC
jgi:hypothetical protein